MYLSQSFSQRKAQLGSSVCASLTLPSDLQPSVIHGQGLPIQLKCTNIVTCNGEEDYLDNHDEKRE